MTNADSFEVVSTDSLFPYISNSRTHSDDQVTQIAASIKEFGFLNPILIDSSSSIIAGHGRLLAAKKLGLSEVPVLRIEHLTEAQRKAYIIADNKLALNAGWDTEILKAEIEHLSELAFDIELLGFDDVELAKMFDEQEEKSLEEQEYSEVFNVIIECKDESEQEKIFNRLDQEGYKCRVQSL